MAVATEPEPGLQREPFGIVAPRAAMWLVVLAPLFYLTYGYANWLAAQRDHVGSIVFDWERAVPFVAWTIIPYWSINLFYALSLFVNDTRGEVDRLAGRYLTAQTVAVLCFIAFPLTATFVRPETSGLPGFMFAVLGGFDKPFNQAPSLHIALLVIIWEHWRHRLNRGLLLCWHAWCLLIGVSVLTTWQHHAIDIPTGALLGFFALWLFPATGTLPLPQRDAAPAGKALKLAGAYALAALVLLAGAWIGNSSGAPLWLFLLWPSLALAIVAWAYAAVGPTAFQKADDGSVSLASRVLLLPYRLGARLNIRFWTSRLDASVPIAGNVSLGRFPSAEQADGFTTVIDLSAEMVKPAATHCRWVSLPAMDLLPLSESTLSRAAAAIDSARCHGPVLVCCALGFGRSAAAMAAWLIQAGLAADVNQARAMLAAGGRPIHIADDARGSEAQ